MRILIVCLGNICRSPIAEGVLQHKAAIHRLNWTIDSAGTESYHIGEAPHYYSQKVCMEHGIDISHLKARKLTIDDFTRFDKIYSMATDVYEEIRYIAGNKGDMKKVDLFLNELHPGKNESVTDPYYGTEDGFRTVYHLIDKTCDAIINKYKM